MGERLLAGKTALVTGASRGIGKASVLALAEDGAAVVMTGRREEALAAARDELRAQVPGARIEMLAGDATSEADVKAALDLAHSLSGRLDMVVSVVGQGSVKPLLMQDLDGVRSQFEANFLTAFLAVRHGAPLMETGGAIVCVSSATVIQPGWGLSVYASAKAAVERFVRAAAFELGGAGIRINAVRPGMTLPPERQADPVLGPVAQLYKDETPLGRIGLPVDVARVIRFLAGPESGWVTGQTFSADGGLDQGKAPDRMDAIYGKEPMDRVRAGKPPKEAG